jgi:hypothetical protein
MTDSIQLNYLDDAGAIVATPVFYLDAADVEIDNAQSIENFEIPGMPWNMWFDNNNVARRWTITGKFRATNVNWVPATSQGRPLDFEKNLSCFLNGIDSTTGALLSARQYGFAITLNQLFEGGAYSTVTSTYFSGTGHQVVRLLPEKHNIKLSGGSPGVVEYTLSFVEVESITNMGI